MNRAIRFLVILATVVVYAAPRPGLSQAANGTLSSNSSGDIENPDKGDKLVEYCMTGETDMLEERRPAGSSQAQDSFPLYGSREEQVFRNFATIISYDGTLDNKLKRAFRRPKNEAAKTNCVYVEESAPR